MAIINIGRKLTVWKALPLLKSTVPLPQEDIHTTLTITLSCTAAAHFNPLARMSFGAHAGGENTEMGTV